MFCVAWFAHRESLEHHHEGIADGLQLRGYDGQYGHVDPVELVKTTPRPALTHA
jgi:hypothetical protein